MQKLSYDSLHLLRQQLSDVKTTTQTERDCLRHQLQELTQTWSRIDEESKLHEREIIQRLTLDHELELNDIKKVLFNKDAEIETLRHENTDINEVLTEKQKLIDNENTSNEERKNRIKTLENTIEQSIKEREKAVNEMRERLVHAHRTEIESLRCRFKLMTSMDNSPTTDSSLEKLERPNLIELVNHESILLQTKEDLKAEKAAAVRIAVDRERLRLETQFFSSSSPKSPTSSGQDMYRRILDEKERQIDNLRERETMLAKENMKLKETIQAVADSEPAGDDISVIKMQLENMCRDKQKLLQDLESEKNKRIDMEKSVMSVKT